LPAGQRRVCAAGALANLDLLVLLDQAKRTKKQNTYVIDNQAKFYTQDRTKKTLQSALLFSFSKHFRG
jgi:hypothetical protein